MAETAEKMLKYVVVADAVVVTIGKKADGKPIFTRVMRGGVVQGPEGAETLDDLVSKGAIVRAKSREHLAEMQADLVDPRTSRLRQTVRMAAAAQGAPDDPVKAPDTAILPLPAPNPETDPDALLGRDIEV